MKKLTHQELVDRQKKHNTNDLLPFCIVLNNIRSLHNVGSIFRTADGAGIEKIWLCGITGYPPNPQLAKTALGAEEHVVWEYKRSAKAIIGQLKSQGYHIVFIEQMQGGINYRNFQPQGPVCLVLGNEVEGVQEDIVPLCDQAIEIEMVGIKNSLNVAVAFSIIAYHLRGVV
ncbi:tRNA/rRNA methyltransferase [hydrothermal vent metagenome]|uniref:tRNA/rRNA methyltransferase n=1 Tax=hydrothermal vent metagenome TaxID=652676 RepID=A0A3B1DJN7_9ZZZZ